MQVFVSINKHIQPCLTFKKFEKVLKVEAFMSLTNRFMYKGKQTVHYLECHYLLKIPRKFQFISFQLPGRNDQYFSNSFIY